MLSSKIAHTFRCYVWRDLRGFCFVLVSVFFALLLLRVCRASPSWAAVLTSLGESSVTVHLCISAAPSLPVQLCRVTPRVVVPQSRDIPTCVFSHLSSVSFPVWEVLSLYVPQPSPVYTQAPQGHCGFSYSVLLCPSSFCCCCRRRH